VALVLAHLDWSIDPKGEQVTDITARHIGRACDYVGEHLRRHAHRAYGAANAPKELRDARRIGEIIIAEGLAQIETRKIQRREMSGLQSAKEIAPAIAVLIEADWLAPIEKPTGGRPKKIYAVNPKIGMAQ